MKISIPLINEIIDQGIDSLLKNQVSDGYFINKTTHINRDFSDSHVTNSSFITSLVLLSCRDLPSSPQLDIVTNKAIDWLLTQKSSNWSYNYWIRNSPESTNTPYPNDLDCTFCALAAIYLYRPEILVSQDYAKIVALLTTFETKTGGPYRTWLVPLTSDLIWRDIDPAVNANIAYFLYLQKISLPKLNAFIKNCIIANKLTSPYYDGSLPIIYFISRFITGSEKLLLIHNLKQYYLNKIEFINPLNIALKVSAMINLGVISDVEDKDIEYLIKSQELGEWQAYPLVIEGGNQTKNRISYAGSAQLTSALCLEALAKYIKIISSKNKFPKNLKLKKISREKKIYLQIIENTEFIFKKTGPELRKIGIGIIQKTLKGDRNNNITMLPYYFSLMLSKNEKSIPEEILVKLGVINLLGWIAYTIYDNFLDNEGNPKLLSVANIALRSITVLSCSLLPDNPKLIGLFLRIMNEIDTANTWETSNCRLHIKNGIIQLNKIMIPNWKSYEKLAERSMGHAFGPFAILIYLGFGSESMQMINLRKFFTHYLIARQLNDDAHDWKDDLMKGQLNPIVSLLISRYLIKHPKAKNNQKLNGLTINLSEIFWYELLPEICSVILSHLNLAKTALNLIPEIENAQPFTKILDDLILSTDLARREQHDTISFLKEYIQNNK
jgi:hypothetical protein